MENYWKNKKVFITGGNGFLGSHLTEELINRGVRPVVLVYEDNPGAVSEQKDHASKTEVIRGDIRNLALLQEIVRTHEIDTIFHLAAQAIVDQALDDPLATFEANIQGTWNILEVTKQNPGVKRVVVASSDKAYGQHDTLPYVEDTHTLKAAYPYEVSKTCTDLISQSFARTFGLPITITRCANLYGPGDLKMNRLIPRTIAQLHRGEAPVIRDTGASVRDYLYVQDAVEAYCLLAEKMHEGIYGEAFNFSTNTPVSVLEAIQTISDEMGVHVEPEIIITHGMEIRNQYASYDKAKKHLGWEPTHTFAEGVRKTIPWYVEYLKSVS